MAKSVIQMNPLRRLKVGTVTWTTTIPADGSTATNLKTLIDAHMPSGSTCLGVVGFTTNDQSVMLTSCRYENSNYSLQTRNIYGQELANKNIQVYYLYY